MLHPKSCFISTNSVHMDYWKILGRGGSSNNIIRRFMLLPSAFFSKSTLNGHAVLPGSAAWTAVSIGLVTRNHGVGDIHESIGILVTMC